MISMIDGKRFTQLMCQTHTILTADQLLYKFLVDIKLAFPNQSSVLAKCSARTFPSLSIWSNCWQSRPPKMDTCQVKLSRKFFKHSYRVRRFVSAMETDVTTHGRFRRTPFTMRMKVKALIMLMNNKDELFAILCW